MDKQYIICEETANKILNYLASRPYAEVVQLVADLQKISPMPKPCECDKQKEE